MPAPALSRLAARVAVRAAGLALAAVASFALAQTPPTPEGTKPGAAPADAAAPAAAAAAPETPPAPATPIEIALVLPLDAPAYARAADAVRAGFLAAADAAGAQAKTKVYPHGDDGVLAAFEAARGDGAKVIVGPLVRDDLKVVAAMTLDLPPTIALNQLDDSGAAPANLYTLALSIDADARLIARRLRADAPAAGGAPARAAAAASNVVVIGADSPLLKRFGAAFTAEWMAAGGSAPGAVRFDPAPDAMNAMRRDLNRKPPDAALLALDGSGAALAKPYLGSIPAYASGLVFERETAAVIRDLDGLMVTEVPWIIDPEAPQFASLPRRDFPSAALTRLYALGLDAFRVAQAFADGPPVHFTLDGATGQITLDGRQFVRESRFAVFRSGQLTPLDGAR